MKVLNKRLLLYELMHLDFLENFDRADDIDSLDDDEGDSSDVETEYNGYEQDYVYAKDNCADEELLEMINNDEDG